MRGLCGVRPLLLALVLALASTPRQLASQETGSVIGAVLDEATRAPLVGAAVSVVGWKLSSLTNADGHFNLQGVPTGEVSLRLEHLGHVTIVETATVSPEEATFVQFTLSPVAFVLDQLRVIVSRNPPPPEGTAFSEMEPKLSEASGTAMDLLVARFPSLTVTGGDRDGGAAKRVQLRGVRSLMISSVPALYVDGIATEMSVLAGISSGDVRSIRVLRGPSASSLYPNASNGVILVETRRGKFPGGR